MRGTSMPDVGEYNEKLVIQAVRRAPDGISQAETARRTGLSRQAVSLIVRRLLDQGLLRTDGSRSGGRGKPSTVLRVVPESRLAIGVHLDPSRIAVVLVDLDLQPRARRLIAAPTRDPETDIARIGEAIESLRHEMHAELRAEHVKGRDTAVDAGGEAPQLLGVGIASPGGIDPVRGIVVDPPWLPGWRHVAVVDQLSRRTGLPAILAKDTHAALTAELWGRPLLRGATYDYLYVGDGIGSASAEDGTLRHGGGRAGEIGHLPTGIGDAVCSCGRRGCLNLYTDARRVIGAAREAGIPVDEGEEHGVREQLELIASRANDGDPVAAAVLELPGRALGSAVRALIDLHDPAQVIIGGPYWHIVEESTIPHLQRAARDASAPGTAQAQIVSSHLGPHVGAIGAASLFMERDLAPRRLDPTAPDQDDPRGTDGEQATHVVAPEPGDLDAHASTAETSNSVSTVPTVVTSTVSRASGSAAS